MSTEARAGRFPAVDWEGGAFPYRVGHRKLGMWLFIVSDSLTFSAGIASWNGEEGTDAFIERADTALYAAKAAGKNRTVQQP